jgi:GNAT superfamily N-acetyltransferase
MAAVHVKVESEIKLTPRVKQLSGMFDAPIREKLRHEWQGDVPIEERDWNVGLIVGPSGAGKSSIARQMFGERPAFEWKSPSMIDDFAADLRIDDITQACSAVGFNTIPSWAKPFAVLSTGEQFRVEVARHLLEDPDPIVVDEFTSVVDRQVAKIGAHAVQKIVRKQKRKFIAVTCHYDVIDWLQPDWMLEPATMTFQWRSVQRRPGIDVEIARVDYSAWQLFAPFHYLTAELHRSAACFVLFVEGAPAAFGATLHRPHARVDDIKGLSRLVTLPDYQGLGLAFVLSDHLGACYKALGYRYHTYPAHPALVRGFDRSSKYALHKAPGKFSPVLGRTSGMNARLGAHGSGMRENKKWKMGGRPCAVFEYCGPPASIDDARALIG